MSANQRTNRNARIATALVFAALVLVVPTVGASDEPDEPEGQAVGMGDCLSVDPWQSPPAVLVNPPYCVPPL